MTKFPVAGSAETEMDPPVRAWLRERGFEVRGEVRGVDLLAVRGDLTVAVELKTAPGLRLAAQALDRQKLTPLVYAAVPRPANLRKARNFKDLKTLCRRTGVGLLVVATGGSAVPCQEMLAPDPTLAPPVRSRRLQAALKEWKGRTAEDRNRGGSSRRKIVTAYREFVVRIARRLRRGPATPAQLREEGFEARAAAALRRDYYGWFRKTTAGRWGLTPRGRKAVDTEFAWMAGETGATGAPAVPR